MTEPMSTLALSELAMQRIHEGPLSKKPAKFVRNVRAIQVPFPISEAVISRHFHNKSNTMNTAIPVRGLLHAPIDLEAMSDTPKWP